MSNISHEYLTFIINDEEYGVNILAVQEIRVWSAVTDIPNTPDYVKGVINLRGVIVPIIDLRQRFTDTPSEYNENTVVIVLKEEVREQTVIIGIVVDAVSDVYKFSSSDIKKTPNFGTAIDNRFINGMATKEDSIIILLDSKQLLDVDELYQISQNLNNQMAS